MQLRIYPRNLFPYRISVQIILMAKKGFMNCPHEAFTNFIN